LSSYADTSFLVSLYVLDANSASAAAAMKRAVLPLSLTAFGKLELTNAISLRLFRKELSASRCRAALALVNEDLVNGVLLNCGLPSSVLERAETLSRKQTPRLGTRTLDVLHVASALALRATGFYTFDARQSALAAAEGLRVR